MLTRGGDSERDALLSMEEAEQDHAVSAWLIADNLRAEMHSEAAAAFGWAIDTLDEEDRMGWRKPSKAQRSTAWLSGE